jgi:hypothetical protein
MLVEITAGFGRARLIKIALGFGTPMGETIFSSAFFRVPLVGSLPGRPQIDDFSHA